MIIAQKLQATTAARTQMLRTAAKNRNMQLTPQTRIPYIISWNAKGIHNKREEIQAYLDDQRSDIVLLSEIFLKQQHKFVIMNYKTYRTDRRLNLNLINSIQKIHSFPKSWKHVIVIIFLKPNKNHTLPQNHIPISLLNILYELTEKTIYYRVTEEF